MYLAADAGIFRSLDNGEDWKRVFVQLGRETQDDDSADDGGKEEDTAGIFRINFVKTDANNVNCVYFPVPRGFTGVLTKGIPGTGLLIMAC